MADESIAPIVRPRASPPDGRAARSPHWTKRTTEKSPRFLPPPHARGAAAAVTMEAILDQQADLLRVGEELIRESSRELRDAAAPGRAAAGVRAVPRVFRGGGRRPSPGWSPCFASTRTALLVAVATRKSETAQTCVFAGAFLVHRRAPQRRWRRNTGARSHAGLTSTTGRLPFAGARDYALIATLLVVRRELPAARGRRRAIKASARRALRARAARAQGKVTRYARTAGGASCLSPRRRALERAHRVVNNFLSNHACGERLTLRVRVSTRRRTPISTPLSTVC